VPIHGEDAGSRPRNWDNGSTSAAKGSDAVSKIEVSESEDCKHGLPQGTCTHCKPGNQSVVYLATGTSYHQTSDCSKLLEGLAAAEKRGAFVPQPKPVKLGVAIQKNRGPCAVCC
jgi:hypothetical protein